MNCQRSDCSSGKPGTFVPVLVLRRPSWGPIAGGRGAGRVKRDPDKMALGLLHCAECRKKVGVEEFTGSSHWPVICAMFAAGGRQQPVKKKTGLRWLEVGEDWDGDVGALRGRIEKL